MRYFLIVMTCFMYLSFLACSAPTEDLKNIGSDNGNSGNNFIAEAMIPNIITQPQLSNHYFINDLSQLVGKGLNLFIISLT